jgi:hypothetical protein
LGTEDSVILDMDTVFMDSTAYCIWIIAIASPHFTRTSISTTTFQPRIQTSCAWNTKTSCYREFLVQD